MVEPRDVDFMIRLARISLQTTAKKRLVKDIGIIQDHVERITSLDLDSAGIPPTSHPLDLTGTPEADVPRPGLEPEDVLFNAPDPGSDSYFSVPPTLDEP